MSKAAYKKRVDKLSVQAKPIGDASVWPKREILRLFPDYVSDESMAAIKEKLGQGVKDCDALTIAVGCLTDEELRFFADLDIGEE